MKASTSKLVNRMVSKTKYMKNKMTKNGREELQNDDSNEIPPIYSKITKSEKSKNTKLLHLKAQLSLSYKPF